MGRMECLGPLSAVYFLFHMVRWPVLVPHSNSTLFKTEILLPPLRQ